MDVATTPRVYRIRAYHSGLEIVNTTQYLLDSEVGHTYDAVRETLTNLVKQRRCCNNPDDLVIDIYPA